jgi:hypothetical protein
LIAAALVPSTAAATDPLTSSQTLTWPDDSLPGGGRLGGTVGLAAEGTTAFAGATPAEAWMTHQLVDGVWTLLSHEQGAGGDDPSLVTCSNSHGADVSVLGATRHVGGTYRVQPVAPLFDTVWASGIDGPHVRAIANSGATLAVGQPQYGGGDGRIRIYQRDAFNWLLTQEIFGGTGEELGASLALVDEGRLVAGAPGAYDNGAIRIYADVGTWVEIQEIASPACCQTEAGFGATVAAAGPWIAVGSPMWNRLIAGGGQALDVGNVNLYRLDGLSWVPHSSARPVEATPSDLYGQSLALRSVGELGAILLVGAPLDDVDDATNRGAAYLWRLEGDSWRVRWRLLGDGGDALDQFGSSVALGAAGALVGAPYAAANGVGTQGAVYSFDGVVPFFYDGFESGDTAGWSAATP